MRVFTIDLETTVNGGPNGDSPEAHWPNNRVLLWGHKILGKAPCMEKTLKLLKESIEEALHFGHTVVIVGHNLKFDLKYCLRDIPSLPWENFDYYCTMHQDYVISGHEHKFSSLEESCGRWHVPFKKGLDLGALLRSGVKMEDIPDSDLIPYLADDLIGTEALHTAMRNSGKVMDYSNHSLPLADMELTGLLLDRTRTKDRAARLVVEETKYTSRLYALAETVLIHADGTTVLPAAIKLNAPRTISYLLTGQPTAGLTVPKKGKDIIFKVGHGPFLSLNDIRVLFGKAKANHLGYPVPAKKLTEVYNRAATEYAGVVLELRKVSKLLNTYMLPFLAATQTVTTVHPKYHMCSTNTGRLSSANPNGQNMPPDARDCFQAEYEYFHEIDFKQLEIVALAMVSQDPQLIKDLQNGEDVHYNSGRSVMGWRQPSDMTDATRRTVKSVNFGLIFGGTANGLSYSTGIARSTVSALIKSFYKRYPGVEKWQEDFYKEVVNAMRPAGVVNGEQLYDSKVMLHLSKRYFYFREHESPPWLRRKMGRAFSFKPTETKNYPVQGFAGGDIVMGALVELYKRLKSRNLRCKFRCTVHDSIGIDTDLTAGQLAGHMTVVCQQIRTRYNIPFNLEFDIKSGPYWK